MILDTSKEVERIKEVFRIHGEQEELGLMLAMEVLVCISRGMEMERRRCLDIVARKAMNAAAVRAEIERPVR